MCEFEAHGVVFVCFRNKMELLGRPRSGACRVCLKSFKTDDFFRICCECTQKVCEDCASYSKNEEGLEDVS
jgi:hypothetical protein